MSRYGDSARNVFEIYYETGLTLPIYLSRTTWSPTTLVVIKSIGGVTSGKLSGVGHYPYFNDASVICDIYGPQPAFNVDCPGRGSYQWKLSPLRPSDFPSIGASRSQIEI